MAEANLSVAEPLYFKALETRRRTWGAEHPNTLTSINNMSRFLQDPGKLSVYTTNSLGGHCNVSMDVSVHDRVAQSDDLDCNVNFKPRSCNKWSQFTRIIA